MQMQVENIRENEAQTAQPGVQLNREEMLVNLYAAAIRHTEDAMEQITSGQFKPEELFSLGKAYAIVEQLIKALDYKRAPDLCKDLNSLYESMLFQMHEAYNFMNAEPLVPVVHALKELRDTWIEAIEIARGNSVLRKA
jgi:flagellar secretion chaperone FliS